MKHLFVWRTERQAELRPDFFFQNPWTEQENKSIPWFKKKKKKYAYEFKKGWCQIYSLSKREVISTLATAPLHVSGIVCWLFTQHCRTRRKNTTSKNRVDNAGYSSFFSNSAERKEEAKQKRTWEMESLYDNSIQKKPSLSSPKNDYRREGIRERVASARASSDSYNSEHWRRALISFCWSARSAACEYGISPGHRIIGVVGNFTDCPRWRKRQRRWVS